MEPGHRRVGRAEARALVRRQRTPLVAATSSAPSKVSALPPVAFPGPTTPALPRRRASKTRPPRQPHSGGPVAAAPADSSLPPEEAASKGSLFTNRAPDVATRPWSERPRILIVEDDPATARVLRQVLEIEGDGWDLQVVSAGRAAVQAALQTPPRVVLLDIGLPDLDGAEVYRRLRAAPATAEARVIFLTGATSHDLNARGITGGVLLRKPFATRDLADIVRALLAA